MTISAATVVQYYGDRITRRGRENLKTSFQQPAVLQKMIRLCKAHERTAANTQARDQRILDMSAEVRDLQARMQDKSNSKALADVTKKRDELLTEINRARCEANRIPTRDEKLRARRVFIDERYGLPAWFNTREAGGAFELAPATYKTLKGQTRMEFLKSLREQQELAEQDVRNAKASFLTVAERETQMLCNVAKITEEGCPDISALRRLRVIENASGVVERQGSIRWPVDQLAFRNQPEDVSSFEFERGVAFTAWLFQDQLIAKLSAQIREEAVTQNCMSRSERDDAIRSGTARILELQRTEERVICDLEEQDEIIVERLSARHPFALLEIQPKRD